MRSVIAAATVLVCAVSAQTKKILVTDSDVSFLKQLEGEAWIVDTTKEQLAKLAKLLEGSAESA